MTTEAKFDPYQAITNQVIELLESGTAPWRKPWNASTGMPRSLAAGKVYRGINPFLLPHVCDAAGLLLPYWATYKAHLRAWRPGPQWREGKP